MPSTYESKVECSDTCSNLVKAVDDDLDLDSVTCQEITRVVRNHGGGVTLSAAELARNPHHFSGEQVKEAEKEGGHWLAIHVPECKFCGRDQ